MVLHEIVVQGAREHNLKGVDLRVPRGTLTTITGVSGSGKSSLAFDTIFQEGQRRYLESLSAYARQFLGGIEKPRVEKVDGLSPTISIDQKTVNRNPRSTVGTITEIHDYLRLLFARLGQPHCPQCSRPLSAQTKDQIADRLVALGEGRKLQVLAPVVRGRKGEYKKELETLRLKGFVRARVDGKLLRLDEPIELKRNVKHTIEVVVDRIVIGAERLGRIAEAVGTALQMADGNALALVDEADVMSFSARLACPDCGIDFPEVEPRLFSFNSPYGACARCLGLGEERRFDPDRVVVDPDKSVKEGALGAMTKTGYLAYARLGPESLAAVAKFYGFRLDQPWRTLTKPQQDVLLWGSGDKKLKLKWEYTQGESGRVVRGEDFRAIEGVIPAMQKFYKMTKSPHLERFMAQNVCGECNGARLRREALAVRFRERDVASLSHETIEGLERWFRGVALDPRREEPIGREVVKEIRSRLGFLVDVGLGYLPLDRGARTLSGGEAQRVRLATQVGAQLQGVLYVLDEPSIGLHQRDNHRLIGTLNQLRDRGNTVLVVEHDRDTMLASDYLVDVGPGAGVKGGEIVAAGLPSQVFRHPTSITAAYLRGDRAILAPARPRKGSGLGVTIRGARHHNLKDIDVRIPLGCLVAVTGVSGSGKSTLVDLVLKRALARDLHGAEDAVGAHERIEGIENVDKVVEIDQSPIGRTPRSNPATYSGAFDEIRDLFALLPESKARGYKKGRFSFNVAGGRCEDCGGAGVRVVEMQLLADVEVTCETCEGLRYNRETLEIRYRDQTIRDVLEQTIEQAAAFFAAHPRLGRILSTMRDVGLGYMRLGQTATTLSGGEAQRLKLASELARPSTGRTLYLLDEPTTGLHFADIEVLIGALQALVDAGNTVVVIEHNLDVVKVADWIVDLGPEGGSGGGALVFEGTPKQVLKCRRSWTGRMLAEYLKPAVPNPSPVVRETADPGGHALRVFGATRNNLRGVDATVPHGQITVITGVSGSGKTSLAFDTIFAEAQRRFVESMSTYARRFLSRMDRAPVDRIEGLAPAIAIDRRGGTRNPRSTVATSTEVHDYLRMLYARVGEPHCPRCGIALVRTPPGAAAKALVAELPDQRVSIAAPLYRKGAARAFRCAEPAAFAAALAELAKAGFVRAAADGREFRLDEPLPADLESCRALDVVVDRIAVKKGAEGRAVDAFEQAYQKGGGVAVVRTAAGAERWFAAERACPEHGIELKDDLQPRLFSFNSHLGACPECDGLGRRERIDLELLIDRPDRPFLGGALAEPWKRDIAHEWFGVVQFLEPLAAALEFDLGQPWSKLPRAAQDAILLGSDQVLHVKLVREWGGTRRMSEFDGTWEGLCPRFERKWREAAEGKWWHKRLRPFMIEGDCPACGGDRLNPLAAAVTVGGAALGAVSRRSVDGALEFFRGLALPGPQRKVADELLREIVNRLATLSEIGLGYLELCRAAGTLSGGEAQRIRLATQLGNRLVGVLYVLDEPTIGLHSRDTARLIATLKGLRDLGNTILVVEHDLDVIRAADHVIDVGPGAGHRGGRIVAEGTVAQVAANPAAPTGAWLRGDRKVALPAQRRRLDGPAIRLAGARLHNLKDLDVDLPLGVLICVTGVSGSGKSTLVMDVVEPAVRSRLAGERAAGPFRSLEVPKSLRQLAVVDQSPLGPTPASNPATYTGLFDSIREVFAGTPEAKMRGLGKGHFSFNQAGGRCEACEGKGVIQIEMHFLSDVFVPCDACGGKRFDRETLEVRYAGKSIADVLDLEVEEALALFQNHRRMARMLELLRDVGLGYLRLGQPATQLSGGEAQRVKLATELGRAEAADTLYLLDEPTTGLHLDDVARLLDVLNRLADAGNTVVVVEHNLEVIRSADLVIDLGPGGGEAGGEIVAAGPPEQLAASARSETGQRLALEAGRKPKQPARERTA